MSDSPEEQPVDDVVTGEKLQKVLARAGLGSRREMEREIAAGRVKVNDAIATLGDRVVVDDRIEYKGRKIDHEAARENLRVLLYNKPEGEICTRNDPEGRRTVFDSLPSLQAGRWVQIGRLDINTSGLLLFTNDGELANKLMHPSSNIDREYLVRIRGQVTDEMLKNLTRGVELEDGMAQFTDIAESPNNEESNQHKWFYCVVMEGRNREVRRLWESQGLQVSRLKRVRFGNTFIPSHVRVGQWIELGHRENADLCELAGFDRPKKRAFQKKFEEKLDRHVKKLRGANRRR
jgi:23S rRNA pseudouridine2605 synthase